jgi:hypothetical protein
VQDGVAGEMNQGAAIDEGDDLYAGREDMIVQFLDFFMDALQG